MANHENARSWQRIGARHGQRAAADNGAARVGVRATKNQLPAPQAHDVPLLLSLMPPAMVKVLPVRGCDVRLLPKMIGAATVFLPPLLPIDAAPPVLASVNVLLFAELIV